VNGVLLFWGEEKAEPGGSSVETDAKADLEAKFQHIDPGYFGDIKFMICFSVDGPMIRFYVADGSPQAVKQPSRMIPLTDSLDLNSVFDRLEVIKIVFNISRILLTVKNSLPGYPYPLGGDKAIPKRANRIQLRCGSEDSPRRRTSLLLRQGSSCSVPRGNVYARFGTSRPCSSP
jgi:hypothetical protein